MRIEAVDAAATRPLRLAVLRPGFPPDTPTLTDPPGAVHLAAIDDGAVIGTAVLVERPFPARPDEPALQLQGMAVAPDRQRSGVGGRLLDAAADVAGGRLLWCHARTSARGFYERHGWQVEGEEFVGAVDLPHVRMWREPAAGSTAS